MVALGNELNPLQFDVPWCLQLAKRPAKPAGKTAGK